MRSLHFVLLFVTLGAVSAFAQPREGPPEPYGRVLLYSETDYHGECLIVEAGASLENLEFVNDSRGRRWNDRIASVQLEGSVILLASEESRYRGEQLQLTKNSPDLSAISLGGRRGSNWSRIISSVRVTAIAQGGNTFVEWNRRDADNAIRSAYRDLFGRDADEIGLRNYRARLLDGGWTETQLRDDIRRSSEYKNRDLNAIARHAYQEVLGRDPDPSGLAAYTRSLSRGQSDSELRAELRRSREGVDRAAKEIVTRAFREVLKRDPDPAGLATYTKAIIDRGWDENRIKDELRRSPEFQQRRR